MARSITVEIIPAAADSLAATLLLWLPLVIFLRHNRYPLFTPEVGVLLGITALAGLFWGSVMTVGRTPARVAVTTLLAVLVVDVQTDWITTWGLRLLLNVALFGTLAFLLRRCRHQRLRRLVLVGIAAKMVWGLLAQSS